TAGMTSWDNPILYPTPTYSPETPILGGQASLGLGFSYGRNVVQSSLTSSSRGIEVDRSDSVWGWGDLSPIANLAWARGDNNYMVYLTGNIPVGNYQSERLANLGIGHAAIDGGAGYTYYDQRSGREFSAVAGITYNWTNPHTNYRNGIDSHLDWSLS